MAEIFTVISATNCIFFEHDFYNLQAMKFSRQQKKKKGISLTCRKGANPCDETLDSKAPRKSAENTFIVRIFLLRETSQL